MHHDFADALASCYEDAARYCRALCGRSSKRVEAEDVFQDALLRALEYYHTLESPERFRSWLFQIITRTYLNSTRVAYLRRVIPSTGSAEYEDMPTVFEMSSRVADRILLEEALATLSAVDRAALLLHELAGFGVEEIAKMQNARSLSAIKSRLSRSRTRVRAHIARVMGELPLATNTETPKSGGQDDEHR